jgi:AcrR family transcriptional regulator
MVRVSKPPEVRRSELLDVALELCRSHGFEAMSVEQVTRAAGVAKGTFYHHFASKADLKWRLVSRFGESLFDHLTAAIQDASGPASARLRQLMDASASYKLQQFDPAWAVFLYREENYALRHRVFQSWREQARRVLQPVIADGARDGSFAVADVESTTDLVLLLWFDAADQLWERANRAPDGEQFASVMVRGSAAIFLAQARVLGVPDDTYAIEVDAEMAASLATLHHLRNGDHR